MANYAGQGIDYSNYVEYAAPVTLGVGVNTFGYVDLAAIIIIRAATDYLDPATQYNLNTVWAPDLATKLESGQPGGSGSTTPTERWS